MWWRAAGGEGCVAWVGFLCVVRRVVRGEWCRWAFFVYDAVGGEVGGQG